MSRQVTHDPTGALVVRFPFDRSLVDLVKTLPDRRWNATDRHWTVPEQHVVELVELLASHRFRFDDATRELYRALGGQRALTAGEPDPQPTVGQGSLFDADPEESNPEGHLTVSSLNRQVRAILEDAFPEPVWLVGELLSFNRSAHKRHVSFQLVERDESGKTISTIPAVLFERTRKEIEAALASAGDPFRLEDEIEVRLAVRVDLYVEWGAYRVVVEELDLRYTLGEAARRREEILRRLATDGLLERNAQIPLPDAPLRVGLITSLGSDAYQDVLRTFQESGFAFEITAHGARVQGRSTEPSVLNALDWFRKQRSEHDVVLICRGGGSRTDLGWFDSEALGRAVANFPLPIVVGVGHEQDHSVLDAVARRAKTPTAAASVVVDRVRETLERVESCGLKAAALASARITEERRRASERAQRLLLAARQRLRTERTAFDHRRSRARLLAQVRIGRGREALSSIVSRMPGAVQRLLARKSEELQNVHGSLGRNALRLCRAENERLGNRSKRLYAVDPARVLERGYAVLRSASGRAIRELSDAPDGSLLTARIHCGTLRLRSLGEKPEGETESAD